MTKKHIARALPALPPRIDPELKPLLTAIKEVLEVQVGHRGEDLDKAVTFRDLTESGIANLGNQSSVGTLVPISDVGVQTPPPEPVTLTAAATFTNVLLSWGGGFKHDLVASTEVYRSTSNSLATASHIGSTSSFIYTDTVEPSTTNYYWVRFRSPAGVAGPYNSTAGTSAVTSSINDAIPDATINVAKIANLVVDMASVTGTLSASQISAGLITSNMVNTAGISADKITMDGNIEFANTQSGVQFGKTSLGDSQAGAFFGRSGGVAGFNISSSTSGIYADSAGQVALNNVRLYTGSAGSAAEFPNPGTFTLNISSISTSISVIIIGGGGGACNNSRSGTGSTPYGARAGTAGTASWLKWYSGLNGTGSVLATYNAAGGSGVAAGSVGSPNSSASGAAGQASSKAAGGVGGNYGYNFTSTPPTSGTLGSGGGGAAAITTNSSSFDCPVIVSAGAGATISQLINKPSGAQSVKLFVGTGGTGGQGFSQFIGPNDQLQGTNITAGGNGGNGYVSVADPNTGGIEVDLLSIVNRLTAAGI
jgi:hypothetical protein